MKAVKLFALVSLVFFSSVTAAKTQLVLDIVPTLQTGRLGQTITFAGTLRNTGSDELFLNAANHNLNVNGLTLNDDRFFSNAPVSMLGGTSWTGNLFDVVIGGITPIGTHSGSFNILGGLDGAEQNLLAAANFQVSVVGLPDAGGGSQDGEYISPGNSWHYANANSGSIINGTTGFEMPDYDDSSWYIGRAPFSNVGGGDFGANTFWQDHYDPQLRTSITLGTPVDMTAQIGVDNGYELYVNGVRVSANNAEGYTYRWEYTVQIPSSYFVVGNNVIALQLEDHGGLTAFDMRLFGDRRGLLPNDVPEPGSLALFLCAGSSVFLFLRRRR